MAVTVYTTPTCPFCQQVKMYLAQRGVPFREVDVSQDPAAAMEMVRISGQRGVPVTVIDGQVIVGFDRRRLEQALAGWQRRPRFGAAIADAAAMAAKGRTTLTKGVYVGKVSPGSVAERAGLRPGDVIVSFNQQPVANAQEFEQLVGRVVPGQGVPLTYVREGIYRQAVAHF